MVTFCRSIDETYACLSRESGCNETESKESLMNLMSFTFTYSKMTEQPNDEANLINMYYALRCEKGKHLFSLKCFEMYNKCAVDKIESCL